MSDSETVDSTMETVEEEGDAVDPIAERRQKREHLRKERLAQFESDLPVPPRPFPELSHAELCVFVGELFELVQKLGKQNLALRERIERNESEMVDQSGKQAMGGLMEGMMGGLGGMMGALGRGAGGAAPTGGAEGGSGDEQAPNCKTQ